MSASLQTMKLTGGNTKTAKPSNNSSGENVSAIPDYIFSFEKWDNSS
jgi:hypothetical protein